MNFFFPPSLSPRDQIQSRLFRLAALFMFLAALILTLSPAVRYRSWEVNFLWMHWTGFGVWLVGFLILHGFSIKCLPERDPYLLPIVALLCGWGLLTIWRLDSMYGLRQTIWLGVCIFAFWVGIKNPRLLIWLRKYKYIWLTGGLILTALTFFFGRYPGGEGPRLWLGCCGVYMQPSEPLKLLLVAYLAAYLADNVPLRMNKMALIFPTLILVGISLGLLLMQRDLGTASLFILIFFTVLYFVTGKIGIPIAGIASTFIAGSIGYYLFDVIRLRVDAWVNPWIDPSGRSYQIVQSLLAVASGGIVGRGIGIGSPGVVPVAQSDFIFSAIAEETGLFGTIALLALLGFLFVRGITIALRASSTYHRYLAAGISIFLAYQSILIIAGNLRLLPLTGVTLPFVSYGGSSLLTSLFNALLLLLISSEQDQQATDLSSSRPYLIAGTGILAAIFVLSLGIGWWTLVRSGDLLTRTDNPRRGISDRFVSRGSILDRQNRAIAVTEGEPGTYTRQLLHPPLGLVTGYNSAIYGQAGIEASMDKYLRGLESNPSSTIWWNHLLYGTPPPGLDIRLSIDLDLQQKADQLLANHTGAIVILNAQTSEILGMASYPNFDPNQLEEKWNEWVSDIGAPLVNRATQGQYSPGAILSPFLLAGQYPAYPATSAPPQYSITVDGKVHECALAPSKTADLAEAIQKGCPGTLDELGRSLKPSELAYIYNQLGFAQSPSIGLLTATAMPYPQDKDISQTLFSENGIKVTPLQMALATATLSTHGNRPEPILAMAVRSPQEGWIILSRGSTTQALPTIGADFTAYILTEAQLPLWESTAIASQEKNPVTWYISGTLPNWQGAPLALVVVLEENNPALARQIGQELMQSAAGY